jgi:hypothetical protein
MPSEKKANPETMKKSQLRENMFDETGFGICDG